MATLGDSPPSLPLLSQTVGSTPTESATSAKTAETSSHQLQGREVSQDLGSCGPTAKKTSQVKIPPPPPPPRPLHLTKSKPMSPSSPTSLSVPTPPPLPTTPPKPRAARSTSSPATPSIPTSSTASSQRPTRKPGEKPPPPSTPRPIPLDPARLAKQVKANAGKFVGQARGAAMQAGVRVAETADMVKGGIASTAEQAQVGARVFVGAVSAGAEKIAQGIEAVSAMALSQIQAGAVYTYRKINQGAAKVVLAVVDKTTDLEDPTKIIYQPIKQSKARELRLEAEASQGVKKFWDAVVKKLFSDQEDLSQYLVLMEKSPEVEKETGKESYVTQRALGAGAIDKYLADPSTNIRYDATKQLARDVLAGMTALHRAGKVHGDLKPDNILIFKEKVQDTTGKEGEERYLARVSDYGKMRTATDDGVYMHTGNPRFAAPEGVLSKKGEVYSTALIMLSVLEAENLEKVVPSQSEKTEVPSRFGKFCHTLSRQFGFSKPERRGIEQHLMNSADCPQKEVTSIQGKITVYGRGGVAAYVKTPSPASLEPAEKSVHQYIDQQILALKGKGYDKEQLTEIGELLKEMTFSDPSKRPTMERALEKYDAILSKSKT